MSASETNGAETDVEVTSTALVPSIEYGLKESEIAETKAKYAGLTADTKEGYEEVRLAIGHLRTTRTAIEKRRKQLKAGALEYGKRVDAAAHKLTDLIEEIEEPLRAKKEAVDKVEEDARRAAEDAERVAAEAEAKRMREAEEARIAFERAKLEAQRMEFQEAQRKADEERKVRDDADRVERERVAAEQRQAQSKLDAERAEFEAQQRAMREKEEAAARAQKEREEAARKEQEAKEQAERDRIAAEQRAVEEKARAEAESARREAMKPDVEKLVAWAGAVRDFSGTAPEVTSAEARAAVDWAKGRFELVAKEIEKRFNAKGTA